MKKPTIKNPRSYGQKTWAFEGFCIGCGRACNILRLSNENLEKTFIGSDCCGKAVSKFSPEYVEGPLFNEDDPSNHAYKKAD